MLRPSTKKLGIKSFPTYKRVSNRNYVRVAMFRFCVSFTGDTGDWENDLVEGVGSGVLPVGSSCTFPVVVPDWWIRIKGVPYLRLTPIPDWLEAHWTEIEPQIVAMER